MIVFGITGTKSGVVPLQRVAGEGIWRWFRIRMLSINNFSCVGTQRLATGVNSRLMGRSVNLRPAIPVKAGICKFMVDKPVRHQYNWRMQHIRGSEYSPPAVHLIGRLEIIAVQVNRGTDARRGCPEIDYQ